MSDSPDVLIAVAANIPSSAIPESTHSDNWIKIEFWFASNFCNGGMSTELYNRALSAKEALHTIFP